MSKNDLINKVFRNKNSKKSMSIFSIKDFMEKANHKSEYFDISRISGVHCNCGNGKGEFVLDRKDSIANKEGGKLYMCCRICNQYSHL